MDLHNDSPPASVALDPAVVARVRAAFAAQPFMRTVGATLAAVRAGEVEIVLPNRAELHQHHGFVHAAALTAALDTACGFAAQTLMPPDREVLSIEFKVNFMSPAQAPTFRALGRVKRAGAQIFVVDGELVGVRADGVEKSVAAMLATMISVGPRR